MRTAVLLALVGSIALPGYGWVSDGHRGVARDALELLPEELPGFFLGGGELIGHCAVDPDLRKLDETPILDASEGPEHYVDLEWFEGLSLPSTRPSLIRLAQAEGIPYDKIGFGPWAVTEGVEQLAVAFAEHRRWPENLAIQQKALVYAGNLAHYAADLSQPLHTSIHYDGWALPDRSSPRSGIHGWVDGWFTPIAREPGTVLAGLPRARVLDPVFDEVLARTRSSHGKIDRIYRLESENCPEEVEAMARELYRDAAAFVADLFLTAWELSERIELPDWLERPVD